MTGREEAPALREVVEPAGDAACWAARLCAECGAMREGPAACWRCGAPAGEDPRG